jgi:hypothetical protein
MVSAGYAAVPADSVARALLSEIDVETNPCGAYLRTPSEALLRTAHRVVLPLPGRLCGRRHDARSQQDVNCGTRLNPDAAALPQP